MEKSVGEVSREILEAAGHVGNFVIDRLTGGAWAVLAEQVGPPPEPESQQLQLPETNRIYEHKGY